MVETSMRKVFYFLVWLFSFRTWKEFFLRWLGSAASHPASGEITEHILSQNEQLESKLASFLSSLPKDGRQCSGLTFEGDWDVKIYFAHHQITLVDGTEVEACFGEFLEAVASSNIEFENRMYMSLDGDDSCKHVEAFGDALRKSSNKFRKLRLFYKNGSLVSLIKCLSRVLLRNDAIQKLGLDLLFAKDIGKEFAVEFPAFIALPYSLQILKSFSMDASKLDGEGMKHLLKFFQDPLSVLKVMEFYSVKSDAQLEHIGGMLASSTSLKYLYISKSYEKKSFIRGYNNMAIALDSNQSLKTLSYEISSSVELKVLLEPLMPKNNGLQCNTTLTKLQLRDSIGGREGIETLVDMLCTNTSLLEFSLSCVDDLCLEDAQGVENVLAILEAFKTNKSLKKIEFWRCTDVGGHKVLGTMMDLLLENHIIEDINLYKTGLEESGDADYVNSTLSKRKKMKLYDVVQNMAIANPTFGRVFLCGEPYAGKTRLRLSIKQLKEFQQNLENPSRSRIKEKLQKVFKTPHVPKGPIQDKPLERTHGIEVESVQCNGFSITIWDMAGQTDYHSFHELVMPNLSVDGSSSMFLLMCNPMEKLNLSQRRSPSSIKLELETWLRFIASNTRRSLKYRPHVSIVMTHFDYWLAEDAFAKCIDDVVVDLKSQFQEVLEFDEDKFVFKVNGWDESHARRVFDFMKSYMKQLLKKLPKTIRACDEVQHLVALWNADKSNQPLLQWKDFCEGLCKKVKELNDIDKELAKRKKEFVAISLNDGGHIIFNEKEGVVITNPHWFCHQIVGQFLHQCAIKDNKLEKVSANGIISMEDMKCLILKLVGAQGDMKKQFDDMLGIMKKLHICYEQDASSILIPSTLKEKHESLSWSTNVKSQSMNYVGRRLACQDRIRTMLTPGFFTRLQVSFFKKLQSKNDQETYKVFRDIIKFISNGIDVVIQFHQGDIDILLRSHKCQDNMLEFLENNVVIHIKYVQEDPTLGCPGVRLVEYILRPECVRKLVLAKDRKKQCVQVKDLEAKVVKDGIDATYNWQSCEGLDIDYDKVSTLLGSVAWKNLLERRSHDLQYFQKTIQSLGTITQDDHSNSYNKEGGLWTSSIWHGLQRLVFGPLVEEIVDMRRENLEYHKVTWSKLDDVVQRIKNLEDNIQNMQRDLWEVVCSKIDDLMAFSLEMQKSQIPKLAYLCEFGERKLLTRFVPDLDRIQLHLMCESIYRFHEVPNQKGCVVYFGTQDTKRFLTMVAWGLKIATILTKIGAHVACGMGSVVPDFSDGGTFAALILDTSGFLDYRIPSTTLESLPSNVRKDSRISVGDQSEAQRWLQEFLVPKCQNRRDFYEQFRLQKVCYSRRRGSIAWICDECISLHPNEIVELK